MLTQQQIINRVKQVKSVLKINNKRKMTPEIVKKINCQKITYSLNGTDNLLEMEFCEFMIKYKTLSVNKFLEYLQAKLKKKQHTMEFIQKVIKQAPVEKISNMNKEEALSYLYNNYLKRAKTTTKSQKEKELITVLFKTLCERNYKNTQELINRIKNMTPNEVIQDYNLRLNQAESQEEKQMIHFNNLAFPYSLYINSKVCEEDEWQEDDEDPSFLDYDISLQINKYTLEGFERVEKEVPLGRITGTELNDYRVEFSKISVFVHSNKTMSKYVQVLPDKLPINSIS